MCKRSLIYYLIKHVQKIVDVCAVHIGSSPPLLLGASLQHINVVSRPSQSAEMCICILTHTQCKDPLAKTSYSAASEQALCRVERTFFSFLFSIANAVKKKKRKVFWTTSYIYIKINTLQSEKTSDWIQYWSWDSLSGFYFFSLFGKLFG